MPSIEWKYAWSVDRGGTQDPETCILREWDGTDESIDEIIRRIPDMTERYGDPKLVIHEKGLGILWPNGGSWGIWVMTVKP